jgi:predicted regulator of Ras-like GTPase activity (Roadblock/LC7/MglB family)
LTSPALYTAEFGVPRVGSESLVRANQIVGGWEDKKVARTCAAAWQRGKAAAREDRGWRLADGKTRLGACFGARLPQSGEEAAAVIVIKDSLPVVAAIDDMVNRAGIFNA